jgi:Family of unknown function (DUF6325)
MNGSAAGEAVLGPVDMVIIGFPPNTTQSGEGLQRFLDLVDRRIIRVLDIKGVRRDSDGSFSGFNIGDIDGDGIPDLVAFQDAQTGLITDEDLRVAVEAMEPGTVAILIVFENTWAAPFVKAVLRGGGQLLAYERVGAQDLLDAIEALDADSSS